MEQKAVVNPQPPAQPMPNLVRTKVDSSNIEAWAYDPEQLIFEIEFKNGSVYRHYRVPADLYDMWMKAPSKGAFYARELRSRFDCQKIQEATPKKDVV